MLAVQQNPNQEQNLILAIVKKDKVAFLLLYDKYAKSVFSVLCGITGDENLSEELLQRAFCLFWSSASDYQPSKQRLFTWMILIAGKLAKESSELRETKIQKTINYVTDSEENYKFTLRNSKSLLSLIFIKGCTLPEAVKQSRYREEDLKCRLQLECRNIRD